MKKSFILEAEKIKLLKKKDSVLKNYMDRVGTIERWYEDDFFLALLESMISQLVSTKTADTIYQRLLRKVKKLTPENLLNCSDEEIRSCGISLKKVQNMKVLAQDIVDQKLNLEELKKASNGEIIEVLTKYSGIGLWTVEMLLIFTLQREDVISYGDFGIRGGIQKLYGIEKLTKKQFNEIKEKVSPYGSLASLYYWHAQRML